MAKGLKPFSPMSFAIYALGELSLIAMRDAKLIRSPLGHLRIYPLENPLGLFQGEITTLGN